jgi:phosphoribosylanthranilate isomerase
MAQVRPQAVDVSSGIQGNDPRTKDSDRMAAFVQAVIETDARFVSTSQSGQTVS